jgi:hypothetical protein
MFIISLKLNVAQKHGNFEELSGQMDVIIVRYSATNIPSNNRFLFQGDIVKVNRI